MKREYIDKLIEKYFEAQLSDEEERQLRQMSNDKEFQESYPDIASLFHTFDDFANESTSVSVPQVTDKKQTKVRSIRTAFISGIAASFIIGTVAFVIGYEVASNKGSEQQIAQMNQEINSIKEMLMSQQTTATGSMRLNAAMMATKADTLDRETIDALKFALMNDPNENVQREAARALSPYLETDQAIKQLMISELKNGRKPTLQIAIIDILVNRRDKNAIEALEQIINDDSQFEVVQHRAAEGLVKLI